MVQIIEEVRKPSFAERAGSSLAGLANLAAQYMAQQKQQERQQMQDQMELEAGRRLGLDLEGLSPQTRQKALELAFRNQFEKEVEDRKFDYYKRLQEEKTKLDLQRQKDLLRNKYDLKSSFVNQIFGKKSSSDVPFHLAKLPEKNEQEMVPSFDPSSITDDNILKLTAIDPSLGRDARAAKDTALREKRERRKEEIEEERFNYQTFKDNNDYREKLAAGLEAYKRDKIVLDQMEKIANKGNLPKPLGVSLLNKLGLPLGILENPDAEQFDKLSTELLKNIQGTFGSRILQSEVQQFMRSIPTLLNSEEGQKKLINQWKILNEGKKIYYDAYEEIRKENPKRLPPDLHEQVLKKAEPKLEILANEFKKMNPVTIQMMAPDGSIIDVPEEDLEEALGLGAIQI